jgi:Trypsin-co-occurring domain 1
MAGILEYELASGDLVYFEVEEAELGRGEELASETFGKKAKKSFDDALINIKPAIETVLSTLIGMAKKPEEVEVELGIKLNGDVGAVFAKVGTEANFKVKMVWKG